jgi:hypothetical protein
MYYYNNGMTYVTREKRKFIFLCVNDTIQSSDYTASKEVY